MTFDVFGLVSTVSKISSTTDHHHGGAHLPDCPSAFQPGQVESHSVKSKKDIPLDQPTVSATTIKHGGRNDDSHVGHTHPCRRRPLRRRVSTLFHLDPCLGSVLYALCMVRRMDLGVWCKSARYCRSLVSQERMKTASCAATRSVVIQVRRRLLFLKVPPNNKLSSFRASCKTCRTISSQCGSPLTPRHLILPLDYYYQEVSRPSDHDAATVWIQGRVRSNAY
jgi:hypothetical protein